MPSPCPDESVLRGLLDSSLPEPVQGEVVSHLDGCSNCQGLLERIASAGSPLLESARTANTVAVPEASSAFWPALAKVESAILAPDVARTRVFNKTKPANREVDFGFLDPPEKEDGSLGRLGDYQVQELVGRGGMGMVFRAVDPCLGRTVAIKLLDPQYARNGTARERFLREARSAAGVTHENVVTIHQVDCDESRGLSFIVMQFVRGRSLQDLLDQIGPIAVREAVRIAAATAAGLAAAHANNLTHRDVKPGNILIEEPSGRVLLTDFGLARLNDDDQKLTQTGMVAGTPLYMSPEQARGEQVDHRGDLFSLGSVLYTMLTGIPPFQGNSPLGVLKQVTDKDPRPVQQANAGVPDSLAALLERLMEKEPADRFASAADAAAALTEELDNLPLVGAVSPSRRSTFRKNQSRRLGSLPLAACAALLATLGITEGLKLTQWTRVGQRGSEPVERIVEVPVPSGPAPALPDTPTRYTLPPGEGAVWAVAFDPCGEVLATATEDGTVKFWDAREGHIKGLLNNEKYKSPVWSIAFSRDGSQLVTASDDGYVRLWDVKSRKEADVDFKHSFPVRSVALSPDGKKLASGTRNGAVIIWDVETGKKLHSTTGHDRGAVMSIAFSPDGKYVVSGGSDKTVRVWNVEEGTAHATLPNHTGPVYAVTFDPKSEVVASAGWDHTVRLWDVNTSEQMKVFEVHKEDVWSLAYTPDGRYLITGGQDRTAKLINVDTGAVDREYRGNGGPVHAVAVSKDGTMIAAGGRDGTVRVWDVEP